MRHSSPGSSLTTKVTVRVGNFAARARGVARGLAGAGVPDSSVEA